MLSFHSSFLLKSSLFQSFTQWLLKTLLLMIKSHKIYHWPKCIFSRGFLCKNHNVIERIQEEMKAIVNQCAEICQFGILEHSDVLYLAKVDSPEPIRLSSSIGKRLPAYCTSLGKALLCEFSKEELQELYPEPLIPLTPNTVKSVDELYKQLLVVRSTSIAIERGETHPDISCISTPLYHNGKPAASISISVPTYRFTPEKQNQIEHILLSTKPRLEKLLEQNSQFI